MNLYTRLDLDGLLARLAELPDAAIVDRRLVRRRTVRPTLSTDVWLSDIRPTRSAAWPWRVQLEPDVILRPGSMEWLHVVAQHLVTSGDATAEVALYVWREMEILRLRRCTVDQAWRTLWAAMDQCRSETMTRRAVDEWQPSRAYEYTLHTKTGDPEEPVSQVEIERWLAEPEDTLILWLNGRVGTRMTVRQPHSDLVSVSVAVVEPAVPAGVSEETLSKHRATMSFVADRLLTAMREFAPPATARTKENPYRAQARWVQHRDLWRWIYWQQEDQSKKQKDVLAELDALAQDMELRPLPSDTVYDWRKKILKQSVTNEELRAWVVSGPPPDFDLEALFTALLE